MGPSSSMSSWNMLRSIQNSDRVTKHNLTRGTTRNLENALKDERVTLIKGDIRDKDAVYKVTEGMDAVIHMAAIRITACAADPREAICVAFHTYRCQNVP